METLNQPARIRCDFTPPEVSLSAFRSHKTGESLPELIDCEPAAAALKEAYRHRETLPIDDVCRLEQEAIKASAEKLRLCLQYSFGRKPWEEKPQGDCYAYTWLMSDIAERLGMKPMIVYCNGHVFNIIQGRFGQLHMINGESKHMWLYDLHRNPTAKNSFSERVLDQITGVQTGRAVVCSLKTRSLRFYSDNNQDDSRKVTLPWLEDDLPAAKIMTAHEGKRAMFAYTCFQQAVARGDIREVSTALEGIYDCNPQAETREKINPELRQFKKLVKRWAADPVIPTDTIVAAVTAYRATMPETKSLVIFVGDCMRNIGERRSAPDCLQAAGEMYEIAARYYTFSKDQTLEGKILKLRRIAAGVAELTGATV